MKSDKLNLITSSQLNWLPVESEPYMFFVIFEDERLLLRLNDFPEEPLLSLVWREDKIDMDEWPKGWTLPAHRK